MAISGSLNFDLTARQIIQYALEKTNILAKGETMTVRHSDAAQRELNVMLKEWQVYPAIWRKKQASITMTNATASYTPSPRPYRIISVRYRNTSSIDLPMEELTGDEYYDLPSKTTAGTPSQWYFEPSQSGTTLYVWPVKATVTTETFRYTYQDFIDDIDSLDDNLDITPEWLGTVGYNLAARCADDYGRAGPAIDRIIARAGALFEQMVDHDRPDVVRFVPDRRYG